MLEAWSSVAVGDGVEPERGTLSGRSLGSWGRCPLRGIPVFQGVLTRASCYKSTKLSCSLRPPVLGPLFHSYSIHVPTTVFCHEVIRPSESSLEVS